MIHEVTSQSQDNGETSRAFSFFSQTSIKSIFFDNERHGARCSQEALHVTASWR